jgi:hypothetical protein
MRRNQPPVVHKLRFLTEVERCFFRAIVESVPHGVYGCLTFRHSVSDEQADKAFRSFFAVHFLQLAENVGWIRSTERRLSGCSDYGVHLHFHFVMFSQAPLSPARIQADWTTLIGNAKCDFYDSTRNGIGYILKMSHQEFCDWSFSDNLYLFLPGYQPKNRRERRNLERHALRAAEHSTAASFTAAVPAPDIKTSQPAENPGRFRGRVTRTTRLRCPAGCGVHEVIERLGGSSVRLQCGHRREGLLPTKGVSLEHIGTPLGDKLFPEKVIRSGR